MRIPNFSFSPRVVLSVLFLFGLVMLQAGRGLESSQTNAPSPLPALQREAATRYLKEQGLHRSLGEAVRAARFSAWPLHANAAREAGEQLYAANPKQRFTSFFAPDHLRLATKGEKGQKQQVRLKVKGLGYGAHLLPVAAAELSRKGQRIEYQRGELTEWYVNNERGLEQGFTLTDRPKSARQEEARLRLVLALSGDLVACQNSDGQAALLKDKAGRVVLRYSGLKVWDVRNRELPAELIVRSDEIGIEVDDREAIYPLTIDPVIDTQVAKLEASDKQAGDALGFSVSISGDTAIVGAPGEDDPGLESGAAYIFKRNQGGANMWGEVKKLEASDKQDDDFFGNSVSISGDTVIVGATREDDPGNFSGAAYIFERNQGGIDNWGEVKKIEASDKQDGDLFGHSVGISGDTVIVGARREDDPGLDSGAAYIFERNQGGANNWGEVKKIEASDKQAGDIFGFVVSISGDTVIVAAPWEDAPGTDSGAAYIFERNQGGANNWGEVKKIEASDIESGDQFGVSVSISGDTAIIAANSEDDPGTDSGAAYIFERNHGGANMWGEVKKLEASDKEDGDYFGNSVGISGDTAIIGASGDDDPGSNSGAAYIFERNQGGANMWGEVKKIEATDKQATAEFGHSVGISGDIAIVGAQGKDDPGLDSGAAYVFSNVCGQWVEVAKSEASDKADGDFFGEAVAISRGTAIVSARFEDDPGLDSGAAYIFKRNQGGANMWSEVAKLEASDKADGDLFGGAVSISGDTAIVGTLGEDDPGTDSGAAYIFARNQGGADMWGEVAKLEASDKQAGDFFGESVSISGDTAIVGAPLEDDPGTNSGAAYIFERNQGGANNWGEVKKLEASDKQAGDSFGESVSISGDMVIVGANGEDDPGSNSGAAHIFERNQGGADNWGEVKKLEALDKEDGDGFGFSVAISGDAVIVGAFGEDNPGNNSGAVYIFTLNCPPIISTQPVSLEQGTTITGATIANVSDDLTPAGNLTVTVDSSPPGIVVSAINNSDGTITADVSADCSAAPGDNIVTLSVTDQHGLVTTADLIITVTNTSPIVTITGPATGSIYSVGTSVNFTSTFTNTDGSPHTATWMFDSISQAATVVEPVGSTPGTANTSFSFTSPGVYLVKLTVSDNCGGTGTATTVGGFDAMVVVYDPNGGFVTGGGWINSPAGAFVPNPSLTGKANFGFVSKYQTGASVPTGNTEFQFKAGNLNFSSTSYEWMVVAGAKAQYKGVGTINGNGNYRFMLTAIDGQQPGGGGQDKFRIRIWSDGGGLVYDNQLNDPDNADPTTILGGGSIVIHK